MLGEVKEGLMAQFKKIDAAELAANEVLHRYLIGASRITAGNRGGTFVGNRDIAPDSFRSFGIVLPKGGMILPQHEPGEVKALLRSYLDEARAVHKASAKEAIAANLAAVVGWAAAVGATASVRECTRKKNRRGDEEYFFLVEVKLGEEVVMGHEIPRDHPMPSLLSEEEVSEAVEDYRSLTRALEEQREGIKNLLESSLLTLEPRVEGPPTGPSWSKDQRRKFWIGGFGTTRPVHSGSELGPYLAEWKEKIGTYNAEILRLAALLKAGATVEVAHWESHTESDRTGKVSSDSGTNFYICHEKRERVEIPSLLEVAQKLVTA
jgi:hypothetical protein